MAETNKTESNKNEELIGKVAKASVDYFESKDNWYEIKKYPIFKSLPLAIMDVVYSLHQDYERSEKVTSRYVCLVEGKKISEDSKEFENIIKSERFEFDGDLRQFFEVIYDSETKPSLSNLKSTSVMAMSLREFARRNTMDSEAFWKGLETSGNENREYSYRLMGSGRGRGDAVEEIALIFHKFAWEKTANAVGPHEMLVNEKADELLIRRLIDSVHGVGDEGTRYLLMLLGYKNYCKPDIHIKGFFNDLCKTNGELSGEVKEIFKDRAKLEEIMAAPFFYVKNEVIQNIMEKMVDLMKDEYPNLTVRQLDYSIWWCHRENRERKDTQQSSSNN